MSVLTDATAFVDHLRGGDEDFAVPRGRAGPTWDDADLHRDAFCGDPELYALDAVADRVRAGQRVRVLFQLLAASRAGLAAEVRRTLDRAAALLATVVPSAKVLTVFLALRRARANHKHTRRFVLRWLLNHPAAEDLAGRRRRAVVDCLEHALGRDVARACARLADEAGTPAYLRRYVLRYADEPDRARALLRGLYGRGPLPAVRQAWRTTTASPPAAERVKTVTATNRGDISATLVHMYRGGATAVLRQALERYVEQAAAPLPGYDGPLALVLDASASTRGYGEREFACVAQSQALRLVLERCCAELRVYTVGGAGEPPRPEGATDLASALLDALEGRPDLVAIVSDGYENHAGGDLARVVASLPAAGVRTPVVFCHSKFTAKDDVALRRPAPQLPELEFWHQDDFSEILWSLFTLASGDGRDEFVRRQLLRRLALAEEEARPWVSS
jgi:hypothetical protein